tara:strand:- start:28 stop:225 length:198 start_codon:yes stop_codon:yes gene_type:complete
MIQVSANLKQEDIAIKSSQTDTLHKECHCKSNRKASKPISAAEYFQCRQQGKPLERLDAQLQPQQ